MAALPFRRPVPQPIIFTPDPSLIVVSQSVYRDLRNELLKGFNDTASDVDGKYKWETMANVAGQLLAAELKVGADVATLTSVQSKLLSAFKKANDKPELRGNIALALEKQVVAYQDEIVKRVPAAPLAR
jgi:hypothetical protein